MENWITYVYSWSRRERLDTDSIVRWITRISADAPSASGECDFSPARTKCSNNRRGNTGHPIFVSKKMIESTVKNYISRYRVGERGNLPLSITLLLDNDRILMRTFRISSFRRWLREWLFRYVRAIGWLPRTESVAAFSFWWIFSKWRKISFFLILFFFILFLSIRLTLFSYILTVFSLYYIFIFRKKYFQKRQNKRVFWNSSKPFCCWRQYARISDILIICALKPRSCKLLKDLVALRCINESIKRAIRENLGGIAWGARFSESSVSQIFDVDTSRRFIIVFRPNSSRPAQRPLFCLIYYNNIHGERMLAGTHRNYLR